MLIYTTQMQTKNRKKNHLLLKALLIAWCAGAFAYSAQPLGNNSKYDFFHTFSGSLVTELAIAKKENKTGLMLFFGTEHCRFCQRMKATVFTQPSVQQFFRQHFQVIDIDIESKQRLSNAHNDNISYATLAKDHRVRLTPTLIFIDLQGEPLYRQVGIVADPLEFIWLGEYISTEQMNRQSFAAFKKNKRRSQQP